MAQEKVKSPYIYAFSFVVAVIIGICCAIDAAYFMNIIGGVYALAPILITCSLAALVINAVLYANELPNAINDLGKVEKPSRILIENILRWIKQPIALISGLGMALNTYWAFISIHLAYASPFIITCFCFAYGLGTYALIVTAFDLDYHGGASVYDKFKELNTPYRIIALVMAAILITSSYWGIKSMAIAATHAVISLIPALTGSNIIILGVLCTFMFAGEIVFSSKVALWIASGVQSFNWTKLKETSIVNGTLYFLTFLYGVSNAALNAASNAAYTAIFGFFDAIAGAIKAINEVHEDLKSAKQRDIANINKGARWGVMATAILIAIWASDYFLYPALVHAHCVLPLLSSILVPVIILTICLACESFIQTTSAESHVLEAEGRSLGKTPESEKGVGELELGLASGSALEAEAEEGDDYIQKITV